MVAPVYKDTVVRVPTCRTSVFKEKWEKLEGTFTLSDMPERVVLYFEGPSSGVDLLIKSVVVFSTTCSKFRVSCVYNIFSFIYLNRRILINTESVKCGVYLEHMVKFWLPLLLNILVLYHFLFVNVLTL